MNDIVIPEITITQQNLVNAVLLYLVCLLVVSVISKKRKWLMKTLWSTRTIYWLLGTFSIAVFLPAIWEAVKLVTGHSDILRKDLRSFAILFATIVGPAFIFWHTFIAQKQNYSSEQESITDRIAKAITDLGTDVDGAKNHPNRISKSGSARFIRYNASRRKVCANTCGLWGFYVPIFEATARRVQQFCCRVASNHISRSGGNRFHPRKPTFRRLSM